MSVQEIKDEALKLSAEDREWLAHELLDSVDEPEDPALVAELERRWEEIVSGKVKTIPMEEVMAEVEQRLADKRAKRQVSSGS